MQMSAHGAEALLTLGRSCAPTGAQLDVGFLCAPIYKLQPMSAACQHWIVEAQGIVPTVPITSDTLHAVATVTHPHQ